MAAKKKRTAKPVVVSKKLKCPKCGNIWSYRGASQYYATCTRCMRKVHVVNCKVK